MQATRIGLAAVMGLGLGGCSRAVQFLSDPPGARIVVNQNYIGDTPCSMGFKVDMSGTLHRSYEVVAYPPEGVTDVPAQYRYLSRWDDAPEQMLFYFKPRLPLEEPEEESGQP